MPENTVEQIQGAGPDDEFSEMRQETAQDTGGLLANLAAMFGVPVAKLANALGSLSTKKGSKLNAKCRCGKMYRYFDEHYQEDQSTCPACRDEAMRGEREALMRPEKIAAQARLRDEEEKATQKKNDERRETVELVAQTVAELLPKLQASKQ